ncbi:MAG: serine/threonine-protein kinase, partial [bacterium]
MEGVSPGFRGMNTGDFRRRIGDFFRSKTSSVAEQNGRFDDYKDWNHFDVLKTLKREGEARLGEAKIDSAESVLNNIEKRNERDFEFLKKFLTEKDAGGKERTISWKDLELVGDVGYQVDEPEKLPFNKVEKEFPREGDGKRYGILKIIGEGGMGRVALAWDARMMRPVVIKMIKQKIANERTRSNFEKEIKLNALFSNNKYLIRTDSVIRLANGELGIVMEYVKGKDLSDYLKTVEFENIQELDKKTAKIMVEVLLGLRELHDQGVVHRDIKPQNILMDEENGEPGNPRARLIDLGLARILSKGLISKGRGVATQLTSAGRAKLEKMAVSEKTDITGTLPYMAPEELDGRATKSVKSDLYSFGVTFYEFITK